MKRDKLGFSQTALMALSLILLILFLVLFLKQSFNNEKEDLNREIGYLFINSFKTLEGNTLRQIIINQSKKIDTLQNDSVRIIAFMGNNKSEVDSSFVSQWTSSLHPDSPLLKNGTHEYLLNIEENVINVDSCSQDAQILLSQVESLFVKKLNKVGMPVSYSIYQNNNHKQKTDSSIIDKMDDLVTSEKYEVKVKDYSWTIIKKILPEIIFSIMLLGITIGAFYLIHKQLQEEKKLAQTKSQFIQNISHELKTPLATAKVALEALYKFKADEQTETRFEYIQISNKELEKLENILERFLNFQQIESDHYQIKYINFSVVNLLEKIISEKSLLMQNSNIQCSVNNTLKSDEIYSDPELWNTLFSNLIDNAIKYSKADAGNISITLSQHANLLEFTIKDTGIGIKENELNKIFDTFYRSNHGNINAVKGHGIGLSLAKTAIEKLGGKISVQSSIGVGSSFLIQVPNG